MRVSETLPTLLSKIPAPVLFWIVPPVKSAVSGAVKLAAVPTGLTVIVPPPAPLELPVTVKPPVLPVVLSEMPLAAPFDEMLRKVKPLPPMVVLEMFSAVPVVVVSVLTIEVLS